MKEKVKTYFNILNFLDNNGPQTRKDIIRFLKIPQSTFHNDINNLVKWRWVEKLNGKYAFKDYSKLEERVENFFREKEIKEGTVLSFGLMQEIAQYVGRVHNDIELTWVTFKVAKRFKLSHHYLNYIFK